MSYSDTAPDARAAQLEAIRAMSGAQRILRALEMSMFARQLAREGVKRQHPEWPEALVERELLKLAFLPGSLPVGLP